MRGNPDLKEGELWVREVREKGFLRMSGVLIRKSLSFQKIGCAD